VKLLKEVVGGGVIEVNWIDDIADEAFVDGFVLVDEDDDNSDAE